MQVGHEKKIHTHKNQAARSPKFDQLFWDKSTSAFHQNHIHNYFFKINLGHCWHLYFQGSSGLNANIITVCSLPANNMFRTFKITSLCVKD